MGEGAKHISVAWAMLASARGQLVHPEGGRGAAPQAVFARLLSVEKCAQLVVRLGAGHTGQCYRPAGTMGSRFPPEAAEGLDWLLL